DPDQNYPRPPVDNETDYQEPSSTMPNVQHILALELFKGMERPEIERLAQGATEVPAARGTLVFRHGDPCTGMYGVMRGQVKVSLESGRGQEKILQLIGEGQSFGEAAL